MPIINCEISLMLTWSEIFFLVAGTATNQEPTFTIADTKLYFPVVTFSTLANVKLLKPIESGLRRTSNWDKYQSKVAEQTQNRYLGFIINPNFRGVNRLFILSFEDRRVWDSNQQYFFPNVETKDCNVLIDGRNLFNQPVKNDLRKYDNIRKIAVGPGNDYTNACFLDHLYFKKYYRLIAIDLHKQQKRDTDPKAIQQINFTGSLDDNTPMFLIIEKVKETVSDFSKETVKVLL